MKMDSSDPPLLTAWVMMEGTAFELRQKHLEMASLPPSAKPGDEPFALFLSP
jgi:hypothetical protein